MNSKHIAFVACVSLFLSSCANTHHSLDFRQQTARAIASSSGLEQRVIASSQFNHTIFYRLQKRHEPLHVYIEGDGFAWATRSRISSNPTPKNPVALQLASKDSYPNVVYIARPCQYTEPTDDRCREAWWSSHRFSKEVIQSISEVINKIKNQSQSTSIHLFGFSGGGAIASLLSAKRNDVLSLRTIAGNLDHEWLTRHHKATPLHASLNPIDYALQISHLPQRHYVGEKDKVIPSDVAQRFIQSLTNDTCADKQIIPGTSHTQGWQRAWPRLLSQNLKCM